MLIFVKYNCGLWPLAYPRNFQIDFFIENYYKMCVVVIMADPA